MSFVAELEPRSLWGHFDHILEIPRPSKGEGKMRDYVLEVAARRGLAHKSDAVGNLVVYKPGSPGHEQAPATILQSHLDMVQEKNSETPFDWSRDPIQPRREGDYLKATGTTLGSDNGIGVAAMLAVMEADDLVHGPLELLFTVDEETGLTGAAGLSRDLLAGRRLLNLDSEEEGVLTIGCAGGADSKLFLALGKTSTPAGAHGLAVRLSGLKGGHSGVDIHLQRGNAIKLLVRALYAASLRHPFQIASLTGGNAHNAIPREAGATLAVSGDVAELSAALRRELEAAREEFRPVEPDFSFTLEPSSLPAEVWDAATTARILALIEGLPHGVGSMSYEIAGLVETSTNLAVVGEHEGRFRVLLSTRSSVATALAAARRRIRASASLAGAEVSEGDGYPGWKPDLQSPLLAVLRKVHEAVAGESPEVGAIHAGLECGIIGEKYPGMDMISFGPQIEFPHSPDERVKVPTVATFYQLLTRTLEQLA